jgi:hypothetical protein
MIWDPDLLEEYIIFSLGEIEVSSKFGKVLSHISWGSCGSISSPYSGTSVLISGVINGKSIDVLLSLKVLKR